MHNCDTISLMKHGVPGSVGNFYRNCQLFKKDSVAGKVFMHDCRETFRTTV
jgi:hypothetical protein